MKCLIPFVAALACALPASAFAEAQAPLPVDAFGTIPTFRSPHLSPDGSHLAAIQSYKGRPVAVIYDLKAAKGTVPAIVQSDDWVVYSLKWVKPNVLMLEVKSSLKAVDGHLRTGLATCWWTRKARTPASPCRTNRRWTTTPATPGLSIFNPTIPITSCPRSTAFTRARA